MFDHYEIDAFLSPSITIEVFKDLEDAEARERKLIEGFKKLEKELNLKGKIEYIVHIDRSLNMETYEEEYRMEVTIFARELRMAVTR